MTDFIRIRMLFPLTLVIYLAFPFASAACNQQRSSDERLSGFVYAVRGQWNSSRTNKAVCAFDLVFAGDKIRPGKNSSADAFVGIALYDSTTRILRCQGKAKCDSYLVPAVQQQDKWLDRVVKSVRLFWPSATTERVRSAARTPQAPQHAVVPLASDGTLNLTMALSWIPSGNYFVLLTPLHEGSNSSSQPQFELRVTPQFLGEQTSSTSTVVPGAYKLRLLSSSNEHLGDAIVVIVPSSEFDAFNAAYSRIKKAITAGPVSPTPEETAPFLAACLVTIFFDKSLVDLGPE
jgi:hypothetical protein